MDEKGAPPQGGRPFSISQPLIPVP